MVKVVYYKQNRQVIWCLLHSDCGCSESPLMMRVDQSNSLGEETGAAPQKGFHFPPRRKTECVMQ